jgi:hypothetical protein
VVHTLVAKRKAEQQMQVISSILSSIFLPSRNVFSDLTLSQTVFSCVSDVLLLANEVTKAFRRVT